MTKRTHIVYSVRFEWYVLPCNGKTYSRLYFLFAHGRFGLVCHSATPTGRPARTCVTDRLPTVSQPPSPKPRRAQEYIFSFLLSSRLFVRPHELLGRLLAGVPELEPLDRLVGLLGIWTNTFPYDFRDERIMCHVKHIVARFVICAAHFFLFGKDMRRLLCYPSIKCVVLRAHAVHTDGVLISYATPGAHISLVFRDVAAGEARDVYMA